MRPPLWLMAAVIVGVSGCGDQAGQPALSSVVPDASASATLPARSSSPAGSPSPGLNPGALSMGIRIGHTATRLKDGTILIAGGAAEQPSSEALNTAVWFNPITGELEPAGKMQAGREFHTATLLADGRVLVAGGQGSYDLTKNVPEGTPLASAELYDPKTNSWSAASSMQQPRDGHTATRLKNGRVLVVGGSSDVAEIYDPLLDTWSLTAPRPRTTGRGQTATLLTDGRVLLAPGFTQDGMPLAPTTIYNPSTNSWTQAAAMTWGRTSATGAVLLPDGDVMVVGSSAAGVKGSTAQRYRLASNSWSAILSDTNDSRYNFWTVVALPDGRALGLPDLGHKAAKVYDPVAGSWSEANPMKGERSYGYSATGLADGRVLLAGGLDNRGTPLSSLELYVP